MKKQLFKQLIGFLTASVLCANIGIGSFIFSNSVIPPLGNSQENFPDGKAEDNHFDPILPGNGGDNESGISPQNDEPQTDVKTM